MGCENSQVGDLAPQQPHLHEDPPLPHQANPSKAHPQPPTTAAANKQTPPQATSDDKENAQPHANPPPQGKDSKPVRSSLFGTFAEQKKKSQSEHLLEENPMAEVNNLPVEAPKGQQTKQSLQRDSRRMSARSSYKAEAPVVGPSCKTIEAPAEAPDSPKPANTGEEAFPITKVLKEEGSVVSIGKGESVEKREEGSERVSIQPFVLEQWDKPEQSGESCSPTRKILTEEVGQYLEGIWAYEGEIVEAVVAKLEERQYKRYEGEAFKA